MLSKLLRTNISIWQTAAYSTAYIVGLLIDAKKTGGAFDTGWIWKCIVIQVALVLLRFFFDYLRARYQ